MFERAPIDRLHLVKGGLGLRDLHLSGSESALLCPVLHPAREEGLAVSVLPSHRLEDAMPGACARQLLVERCLKAVESDSECLQTTPRHRAVAQRCDDLASPEQRRFGHYFPPKSWRKSGSSKSTACSTGS